MMLIALSTFAVVVGGILIKHGDETLSERWKEVGSLVAGFGIGVMFAVVIYSMLDI